MGQLEVWWEQLIGVLRDTIQAIVTYFPVVLTSIAVLIIGWLLARVLRSLVRRAIESMDWLFERLSMRSVERSQALTRITTRATSRAISSVVYWSVLLIFAANALRILGGPLFARWTDNLLGYLPQAIGGVVIIVLSLIGGIARRATSSSRRPTASAIGQSSLLGRLAQGVIVITGRRDRHRSVRRQHRVPDPDRDGDRGVRCSAASRSCSRSARASTSRT